MPEPYRNGYFQEMVNEYKKSIVIHALDKCGWNQTAAADFLGISRPGIRMMIDRYGIRETEYGRILAHFIVAGCSIEEAASSMGIKTSRFRKRWGTLAIRRY